MGGTTCSLTEARVGGCSAPSGEGAVIWRRAVVLLALILAHHAALRYLNLLLVLSAQQAQQYYVLREGASGSSTP
jgi:hypothetical protein